MQNAVNFNDIAIVCIKGSGYRIYCKRNKKVILNRAKEYYENNKEVLTERARNTYKKLSEEEKNIKREYGRN